jgi:hypothetical protein
MDVNKYIYIIGPEEEQKKKNLNLVNLITFPAFSGLTHPPFN